MVTLEQAIELSLNNALLQSTEHIPFTQSLHRILADNIYSDMDIPLFNKSAMDGYAFQKADIAQPLKIIHTIHAGEKPIQLIKKGECVKIMTGASLPENADYVAKIEDTSLNEKGLVIIHKTENKTNIRYASEDIKKNERVLTKGTLIRPQELATLATVGAVNIPVYKKPSIAISSTGNELTEPENIPNEAQIRNSNAYQLLAQCKQMSVPTDYMGIIPDTPEDIVEHLKQMMMEANIIILTGGVSMGDFDFIPKAIKELGFEIIFHTISVQPGKPTLMAKKGNKFCFGLPGNPVSSFLQFELIVKPFIYKMMGHDYKPHTQVLPLAKSYSRKNAERTSLIPVKIKENKIETVEYHGSAHLFAMNATEGFIIIPKDVKEIPQNTHVTVRFL
jgi:molybdopterin molybdotransferase